MHQRRSCARHIAARRTILHHCLCQHWCTPLPSRYGLRRCLSLHLRHRLIRTVRMHPQAPVGWYRRPCGPPERWLVHWILCPQLQNRRYRTIWPPTRYKLLPNHRPTTSRLGPCSTRCRVLVEPGSTTNAHQNPMLNGVLCHGMHQVAFQPSTRLGRMVVWLCLRATVHWGTRRPNPCKYVLGTPKVPSSRY